MLMTKWGEDLCKNNPLSEYPRPQFERKSFLNLNGIWQCDFCESEEIPDSFSYDIVVPFSPEAPLSGVNRTLKENEYLIYQKVFDLPDDFNKGRVFINFGAVDQIAKVYINGNFVGVHHGGYTPFSFEISDYICQHNVLNVVVRDLTEKNEYLRGKQKTNRGGIWYTAQSGIWQTVWLESTPNEYIKSVRITPDIDNERVVFETEDGITVQKLIYDGDDLIADTTDNTVVIDNPKLWSPDNPFLYKVVFKYKKDTVYSYFGMRKFSVGTDDDGVPRLMLNNKPYFMNGLLDQGYYPDGYLTPPSNKAMEFDVSSVKKLGFNMLRKHIKIEPMLWYHYCDVNGIIVWQDMINGGGNYGLEVSVIPFVGINLDDSNYKIFKRTNDAARKLYYEELKEMINALYNCPCIAVWVPFNEGWGQFDSNYAYMLIRSMDNTRIVDSASGWHDRGDTDIISKHIYFTPIKVRSGDKPWCLTEFGGLSTRVKGHTFNDKMFGYKIFNSKEGLTKAFANLYEKTIIPQIKDGLSATVYTQVTDVEDELNGLFTYDRKVQKIDTDVIKSINERIKI